MTQASDLTIHRYESAESSHPSALFYREAGLRSKRYDTFLLYFLLIEDSGTKVSISNVNLQF